MVNRAIESAQRKVEGRNFDIRKQLLQYDDVANEQRKEIYALRNEILEAEQISEMIANLRHSSLLKAFRHYIAEGAMEEQWDIVGLQNVLKEEWAIEMPLASMIEQAEVLEEQDLFKQISDIVEQAYQAKVVFAGTASFAAFERSIMLQSIDIHWREHLATLDHLRQGIHLRGYAQKDPKQEYKREAFELFAQLLETVKQEVTRIVMTVQLQSVDDLEQATEAMESELAVENIQYAHPGTDEPEAAVEADTAQQKPYHAAPKIGRNEPCPCQSGKKYKHCHGRLA